jgi:hypothetical protein
MKFVCPVCKTAGNIRQDNLDRPVTKATCQNCGTIMLIDAHKSPFKNFLATETSGSRSTDKFTSVLTMQRQGKNAKDWTAIVVVVIILIILSSSGVYLTIF